MRFSPTQWGTLIVGVTSVAIFGCGRTSSGSGTANSGGTPAGTGGVNSGGTHATGALGGTGGGSGRAGTGGVNSGGTPGA